ncbi:MAG: universal stress protein [Bacteroidetes bacterium]|nr:universal stress protein [Bacteroidota bacterium]
MKKKIIVPTDFTKAAIQAIKQAVAIAMKADASVTLFHVIDDNAATLEETRDRLTAEAESISKNNGISCEVLIKEGSVFDMIANTVCEKDYDLMVIGTHGATGIRQKLFGADILKLVARVPVPVLVVQEDSPLVETFSRIVLPVGSHDNFHQAVNAVLLFAGIYDVEVHLYSIHKPGFDWPLQMLTNIEESTRKFEERGVRMIRIKEEQTDFSPGYARQTLRYARSIGADTMWMMSVASQEYYYMAKAYKEAMLLNDAHLPVLCAGGGAGA